MVRHAPPEPSEQQTWSQGEPVATESQPRETERTGQPTNHHVQGELNIKDTPSRGHNREITKGKDLTLNKGHLRDIKCPCSEVIEAMYTYISSLLNMG